LFAPKQIIESKLNLFCKLKVKLNFMTEKDLFLATDITVFCRDRIKNLINNATKNNLSINSGNSAFKITFVSGEKTNKSDRVTYHIPFNHIRKDQFNYLMSLNPKIK
jgi:hypothetical protein